MHYYATMKDILLLFNMKFMRDFKLRLFNIITPNTHQIFDMYIV